MQIARAFMAVGAAAWVMASLPSIARDTEVQIKAREELEKKLNELQNQQAPPPTQPPAPSVPPQFSPPRAAPPAMKPQPSPIQPVPSTSMQPPSATQPPPKLVIVPPAPSDSSALAKARAAMRVKLDELQTQPSETPAPAAAPPVAATAK